MRLLTANLAPIASDSWLQFDSANHEFFGIPLAGNVGKTEYHLRAVRGVAAAHFSITLQQSFREFMRNGHLKARLVERIATVFGDPDPRHVAVDAITQGSVVVTWHNTSLPGDPCPDEEMGRLRRVMLDDDGQLLPSFVEAFAPEYRVVGARLVPSGMCLGGDTPTHVEEEPHQPPVEDTIQGDDNDYLINFIIPAVIIAAMLLLAAVIACCLYRRRRYGKMTMADDRTFVSKGIPIIFAEELDDRPDPAKSPVIMKEEKPPLPPPEYQRGTSPAATATPPPADRRRPHSGEGGDDAPSYQPPPPFTATNGASRHPRPNMPPTYRKPPTYVPP
ncbi:Dystroglycan [Portunus trituberculatus]|uniref:Dystroglycan n=1 Tax=Portunus trituberculatus TaxID=210409 RepID=A0A5B7HNC0_PORTR|nr:Dystroglycan [Portunus trituberculatus]